MSVACCFSVHKAFLFMIAKISSPQNLLESRIAALCQACGPSFSAQWFFPNVSGSRHSEQTVQQAGAHVGPVEGVEVHARRSALEEFPDLRPRVGDADFEGRFRPLPLFRIQQLVDEAAGHAGVAELQGKAQRGQAAHRQDAGNNGRGDAQFTQTFDIVEVAAVVEKKLGDTKVRARLELVAHHFKV